MMIESPSPSMGNAQPTDTQQLQLLPQIATGVDQILDLIEPNTAPGEDKLDLIVLGLQSLNETMTTQIEALKPLERELSLTGSVLQKISERLAEDYLTPM
ncbi:MAG: hypothetical protein ACOVNS_05260, partial [Erythrobacter sp.]